MSTPVHREDSRLPGSGELEDNHGTVRKRAGWEEVVYSE